MNTDMVYILYTCLKIGLPIIGLIIIIIGYILYKDIIRLEEEEEVLKYEINRYKNIINNTKNGITEMSRDEMFGEILDEANNVLENKFTNISKLTFINEVMNLIKNELKKGENLSSKNINRLLELHNKVGLDIMFIENDEKENKN